jgi:hypothetical protein
MDTTAHNVTLVGAGRYGDGLIGSKYIQGKFAPDARLNSVVDPNGLRENTCLSGVPLKKNFLEWKTDLNREPDINDVVEIALKPEIVPRAFHDYVGLGISKFILPKPVTYDEKKLCEMQQTVEDKGIRTAITSQEHYSLLTRFTKAILNRIQGKPYKLPDELCEQAKEDFEKLPRSGCKVKHVKIEQEKERENISDTTPPSCEFPHEVEILSSTDIINFNKEQNPFIVSATRSRMDVHYYDKNIKEGIDISTDLEKKADTPSGRKFEMKVFLDDGDNKPDIITDYDVRFNNGSSECLKSGSVEVNIAQGAKTVHWKEQINENKLIQMYKRIFAAFKKPATEGDKDILTLKKYIPSAKQVMKAQKNWEDYMLAHGYSRNEIITCQSAVA